MAANAYTTAMGLAPLTTLLISKAFGAQQAENPVEYTQVFDVENMKLRVEEEAEIVGTGYASLQPEGRPTNYDGVGIGYTSRFNAVAFGIGTKITREAQRDIQFEKAAITGGRFIEMSMRQTKEWYHAQLFNDETILGGDGVPLRSTSHPTLRGGLQSNTPAIQSTLSESALEEMLVMISRAKSASGMFQLLRPMKLVVTPEEEYNALRILRSVQRSGTTDNDINAIKLKGLFASDPVVLRWLTNAHHWGIKTNVLDGLKSKTKDALEPTTSIDPSTASIDYSVWERYARGCSNWRAWYSSKPA